MQLSLRIVSIGKRVASANTLRFVPRTTIKP
jgi:hypothetical protein